MLYHDLKNCIFSHVNDHIMVFSHINMVCSHINHGIAPKLMTMAIHHAGQFWEKWRISLRRHRQSETQVCGPWFVTDLTIKMIYAIDHL